MTSRVCLVTGAGRGIGREVALQLAGQGHRLALVARSPADLESVAAEIVESGVAPGAPLVIPADVTDPAAAEAVIGAVERSLGPVEVLVLAAGMAEAAPVAETTDDLWDRTMDVNLTAPFRFLRRAVPPMVQAGFGRIVVIASVAAKRGEPLIAAYCASKHGVLGLVRSAALELARTGVTVNAVCPGYVDTPMTDASVAAISARTGRTPEQAREALARRQPTGRLVTTAEVGAAVQFCLDNPMITGQGINVDGGAIQS